MLFTIFSLLLLVVVVEAGTVVKITEGVEKYSDSSPQYSTTGNIVDPDALAPVTPDPLSGPSSLHFLSNYCFTSNHERWEYFVCPFQNITQRRVLGQKVNLLGVWGHWKFSTVNVAAATTTTAASAETQAITGDGASTTDGSATESTSNSVGSSSNSSSGTASGNSKVFNMMQYEEGKSCSEEGDTNAHKGPFMVSTVELICNHTGNAIELLKVDDSKFCAYHFQLGIPIACHLLTLDEGDLKHQHDVMLSHHHHH